MKKNIKIYKKERFKYCPKCSCFDLVLIGKDYKCESCGFMFWQNSKPSVTAIIIKNNKLLLGKRNVEPGKNKWDVPGGFLNDGEHPEAGLKREMKEELGVDIKIKKFIGFFMDSYMDGTDLYNTLCIHYLVNIIGKEPKPLEEVSELKWFSLNSLPKNIAFKSNRKSLKLFKE